MERECLVCGSNDVVTPLLGDFALALCERHREIVVAAHKAALACCDAAEEYGGCQPPPLSERFAIRACLDALEGI